MVTYDPKGHGREKRQSTLSFKEAAPPHHLSGIVHRYLELKTDRPLDVDYRFHALPDACTYLVFDQSELSITGAAQLRASSHEFNLGRQFHYVNIRFFPGVWQLDREPLSLGPIQTAYSGALPLIEWNQQLVGRSFAEQQHLLSAYVDELVQLAIVSANIVTLRIMRALEDIRSVHDMARCSGVSARQLQRILKKTTGFAPHDFLKVLRLQKSLSGHASDDYADQAHYIRSFRRATGYTPGRYTKKYDV